ncbi:MAG TPA: sigma-70 family RNA polymerase sigma factor [Kofleriaceae bacterium]|nr:sigma-70 family RNA polymerase sigma factor [Kofleriaceae bacterium]
MTASSDDAGDRAKAESDIRAQVSAGRGDDATTSTLELYGAEVYGFLHALARDEDLASEAFSRWSEDVWRGLSSFRWDASLRTWVYALARNALHRIRRDPRRKAERNLPLSEHSAVARMVDRVRTQTVPFLRSEVKDELRALRDALDPDDHALLVLRLDRKMAWKDIARALAEPTDSDTDLERRAAALRKRFERAKDQLRALATARGLLNSD